ncbi:hypothetical protein BX666DRAFT_460774 [Dichotomocladium elegans]|nr:hypothetical protein BX666DRAFT_460774 [Dichotomocladium elegans]
MLPSAGLFKKLPCPEYPKCPRLTCVFSHETPKVQPKRKLPPTSGEISQAQQHASKMLKQVDNGSTAVHKKAIGSQPIAPSVRQTQQRPLNRIPPRQPQPTIQQRSTVISLASTAVSTHTSPLPSESQRITHITAAAATKHATPGGSSGTNSNSRVTTTTTAGAGPPRIASDIRSHAPLKLRQVTAQKLYEQFSRIYEPLGNPGLATEHAQRQEKAILGQTTNPAGYKQMAMTALIQLKKRPLATSAVDIGIDGEWTPPQPGDGGGEGETLSAKARIYVLTPEQMKNMGYPELPVGEGIIEEEESPIGTTKKCDRCKQEYIVKEMLNSADETACVFHYGRMHMTMSFGEKQRVYSCCGDSFSSPGCAKGPHVYKDTSVKQMHSKIRYISTPKEKPEDWRALVALDCEMAYTTAGMELIRLTAIDENEKLLIDELVFPSSMVIDLNSRYSGIKTLAGATHNLDSVRQELFKYVNEDTILMGHGLENDLNAMRILHGNVIDTAALFPHPKGLPFRYGLRVLSAKYLSRFIQESVEGHDSFEDAKTCIELLKVFLRTATK